MRVKTRDSVGNLLAQKRQQRTHHIVQHRSYPSHLSAHVQLLEGGHVENLDAGVAPGGDLGAIRAEPHAAHNALTSKKSTERGARDEEVEQSSKVKARTPRSHK